MATTMFRTIHPSFTQSTARILLERRSIQAYTVLSTRQSQLRTTTNHRGLSALESPRSVTNPTFSVPVRLHTQRRNYVDLNATSGKTEADLLVEELQELYDIAKDEFEIATDSTNGSTIYAASDRESARDALNHLTRVYTLYTEMTTSSASDTPAALRGGDTAPVPKEPVMQNPVDQIEAGRSDPLLTGDPASGAPMFDGSQSVVGITPNYNPEEIQPAVKEEVKRRVGQRLRELQRAVETLEMSHHES